MSKTPFSKKCEILGDLWLYYRDEATTDENWSEFFAWADIALPLSHMVNQGLAILPATDGGMEAERFIEDAWTTFCELISIDPDNNYDNLGKCWEASPNAPMISVVEMEI